MLRYTEYNLRPDDRPRAKYLFYVTGRGSFPVDMLRHDRCWPADTDSALLMLDNNALKNRSILIASYQQPAEGRWSTFLWSVGKVRL